MARMKTVTAEIKEQIQETAKIYKENFQKSRTHNLDSSVSVHSP